MAKVVEMQIPFNFHESHILEIFDDCCLNSILNTQIYKIIK